MKLQLGDYVKVKDEAISGIVKRIQYNPYLIFVEHDGFEMPFTVQQLVKVDLDNKVEVKTSSTAFLQKSQSAKKSATTFTCPIVILNSLEAEIDLHMEKLLDFDPKINMIDARATQLLFLKRAIETCRIRKIKKLHVIHGKGEGVLKESVVQYALGMDGVKISETSVRRYGSGATALFFESF